MTQCVNVLLLVHAQTHGCHYLTTVFVFALPFMCYYISLNDAHISLLFVAVCDSSHSTMDNKTLKVKGHIWWVELHFQGSYPYILGNLHSTSYNPYTTIVMYTILLPP